MINDPQRPLIPDRCRGSGRTPESSTATGTGTFSVDTPRTQAAMGFIGGKRINLRDVDIEVTTRNATVAVQSLDDKSDRQVTRDADFAGRGSFRDRETSCHFIRNRCRAG